MNRACPCERSCSKCTYADLCGGCLNDSCVHVREVQSSVDRSRARCLFGAVHGLEKTCPVKNSPPPRQFNCAPPEMLETALSNFNNERDDMTEQPAAPDWPPLIPEASDITETTSRFGVWPDEGDWRMPQFGLVAWDMTGYLFDKLQGAPWVRCPDELEEWDWRYLTQPSDHRVEHLLFVDRLPDLLAINTPMTAIMPVYLNRIWSFYSSLMEYGSAPTPWLLTHGYPCYIDWPPAWHWNHGIRMLSSLGEYLASQARGYIGPNPDALFPGSGGQSEDDVRAPFVRTSDGDRLLVIPKNDTEGPGEMDWNAFPGVIPFIPGADTLQLRWFTEQVVELGFENVALDALNSIGHENFAGIPQAISTLRRAGARHIFVYGPWPLHPPSKYLPTKGVSYIPSANHMDMTNTPARFWRRRCDAKTGEKPRWKRTPSHKRTSLSEVVHIDDLELCNCPACQWGKEKEVDPRSIWRWGHFLNAGIKWINRTKRKGRKQKLDEKTSRLWYLGPSYAVFRKCLHYPPEVRAAQVSGVTDTLEISETELEVVYSDGLRIASEEIRWTWWDDMHEWAIGFPHLGV